MHKKRHMKFSIQKKFDITELHEIMEEEIPIEEQVEDDKLYIPNTQSFSEIGITSNGFDVVRVFGTVFFIGYFTLLWS